jgi:hypothetical protein
MTGGAFFLRIYLELAHDIIVEIKAEIKDYEQ